MKTLPQYLWPWFGFMALPLGAAPAWRVRLEEPTGLYRRTEEIVAVPLDRFGGGGKAFVVTDPAGKELPWQIGGDELLFPGSLMPGELPEYQIIQARSTNQDRFRNGILLRKIGLRRIELGNDQFRVVIDSGVPAIVAAYSLTAGSQRAVNLVETTPEAAEALKGDIHASSQPAGVTVSALTGENTGWTTLGGSGPMTRVELVESGPLRGRLQLQRAGETWEFIWDAHRPVLRWRAAKGFRFAAVSAEPYLPFDRFVDGAEYQWPNGPDDEEPPNHQIGVRAWRKLPGGHGVYYRQGENYGALGVVALDADLNWTGIGSRWFQAEKAGGSTEIALTFPRWQGQNTVLEARRENRMLRQPILWQLTGPQDAEPVVTEPAAREPGVEVKQAADRPAPFVPESLSLDGEWELAWAEKGAGPPQKGWRKVKVPGSAHTQWLEPSQIFTHAAEWISAKEWWYRKTFTPPESFRGKRLRLQFEATDYYADFWLNGTSLGRHEGYIDPFEFDVTSLLTTNEERRTTNEERRTTNDERRTTNDERRTDNELVVRVWTPVDYYWKHRPYTVKGSYGAVDQKPDDITALGITRPVRLTASAPTVIGDVAVATRLIGDDAEVAVEVESNGPVEPGATWELILLPRNFSGDDRYRLRAAATGGRQRLVLPVQQPRLWWTWDHGRPNLYTLEIRLRDAAGSVLDGQSLAVGIREIEKIGWTFYLNRKRLFIRGTNYYYNLFLSEMDRAAYARDLDLMLQMNVNLIRLHCHFTNREFYDLADERGVLLWQDYLEAWYPHDRAFSLRAAQLYDPLIRSVRNHPSVALWTTCDEEDLENYADLTKHLAARPALLDPQQRPVVRSTGRYGDAHVYYGWYEGSIWQYGQMQQAFVSELGATALPNYETLIKFLPDAWPIQDHADEWFFRRLQIPEALRAWGDPKGLTLREYIPRTQAYVARLFQIALERMRRLKYHPAGGVLHFHAIDIWPSVTMAAIDFDRRPTQAFYAVQRSFAPVAASLEYDRDHWPVGGEFQCGVWAINDRWEPVPQASIQWRIVNAKGTTEKKGEWAETMPEDSSFKLGVVRWQAAQPGSYQLRASVRDQAGRQLSENLFEFEVDLR